MPSKNIECQLAQGQIGRYLNGDRFSPEAVQQLESHIAECGECGQMLAKRREAIVKALAENPPTKAVVLADIEPSASTAAQKLLAELAKATGSPAESEAALLSAEPPTKSTRITTLFPKPLVLCGALALVLMAMSYMSKGLLGGVGSASAAVAPEPPTTPPVVKSAKPIQPPMTAPLQQPTTDVPRPTAQNPPRETPFRRPISKPTPIVGRDKLPATPNPSPPRGGGRQAHQIKTVNAVAPTTPDIIHRSPALHIAVHRLTTPRRVWRPRSLWRAKVHPVQGHGVRVYDPEGKPLS